MASVLRRIQKLLNFLDGQEAGKIHTQYSREVLAVRLDGNLLQLHPTSQTSDHRH